MDAIVYNQGYQTGVCLFTIRDTKPGSDCLQPGILNWNRLFTIKDTKPGSSGLQSGIPIWGTIVYNQVYKPRLIVYNQGYQTGDDCLQSPIPNRGPIVYNQEYQTRVQLVTIRDNKPGSDCLQSGI